jgi:hypothetical protein
MRGSTLQFTLWAKRHPRKNLKVHGGGAFASSAEGRRGGIKPMRYYRWAVPRL